MSRRVEPAPAVRCVAIDGVFTSIAWRRGDAPRASGSAGGRQLEALAGADSDATVGEDRLELDAAEPGEVLEARGGRPGERRLLVEVAEPGQRLEQLVVVEGLEVLGAGDVDARGGQGAPSRRAGASVDLGGGGLARDESSRAAGPIASRMWDSRPAISAATDGAPGRGGFATTVTPTSRSIARSTPVGLGAATATTAS